MNLFLASAVLAVSAVRAAVAGSADFEPPVDVAIDGHDGHAMEPFVSRDGRWLFFNDRNQPQDQTDLHVATRVDATRFDYLGRLQGANSEALDGVPSMDRSGRFFFVSPRSYDETKNTLWRGRFDDGRLADVRPLAGDASRRKPFWLNIDAEVSADGETLYVVESRWRVFGGGIKSADILLARRGDDDAFRRPDDGGGGGGGTFEAINTDLLEFAPATTSDERTLYFTRVDRKALREGREDGFGIFVAERSSRTEPFGAPQRIEAINGYVEAPTVGPDGCAIYFHKRVDGVFRIQLAEKTDCRP
ncbi:MAG: hypothetical protein ACFB00_07880 [Parvularculaceae bacterium]